MSDEHYSDALEDLSSPQRSDDEEHLSPFHDDILQCLHTSKYKTHRNRIHGRAEGTCTWVTDRPEYKNWLDKRSGLLWLSADPGCGKSVIASFLVNELTTRPGTVVCYFFFRDDNEEQKHLKFALCALLHQLFTQREMLSRYAEQGFRNYGRAFAEEVDSLWKTLVNAVADLKCDEVICVLDALDECGEETCDQLIRHITSLLEPQVPNIPLRFLVTGRPYQRIEAGLGSRATAIRLRGEGEVNSISADVTRVINAGIQDLESHWKQHGKLEYLRTLLEDSADRTFLWVSLVLEELKDRADYSPEAVNDIASTEPGNLAVLYDKIISKRQCPEKARLVLNAVVAAVRPLLLSEMYAAFAIKVDGKSIKDGKSIRDLVDLPSFETMVKNWCGLFVRVIDSRIYLVHQTARDFLIKGSSAGLGDWQYTICPTEANFIMADICLNYLALEDFENNLVVIDDAGNVGVVGHALLDYAATYWADHFRDSRDRRMGLFERTRPICERGSPRFARWLRVYWESKGQCHPLPSDFTHLMIACWLGQRTVVEQLSAEGDINVRSKEYGTALNITALQSDMVETAVLIQKGAEVYIGGKGYNISKMSSDEFSRRVKEKREFEEDTLRRLFDDFDDFSMMERLAPEIRKQGGKMMEARSREDNIIKFLRPFCGGARPAQLGGTSNESLLESPSSY